MSKEFFKVNAFSPWANYGMNGPFMMGDFNGDGKNDVVHILRNSHGANVWLSKGDGTFDIKFFSPSSDYGMDIGTFLVGDFNGDGKSDMAHNLREFHGTNVWLSKGDGTFNLKFFSPRSDYGMDIGSFLTGDFNGDGKSDMAHNLPSYHGANVWLSKGDGTFDLKFFSPSSDYGMDIGTFLVGDFNGDGKSDMAHNLREFHGTNVWLSKGDGTFNLKFFSPRSDYGMDIGSFLTGDFNGDGKTDMAHILPSSFHGANVWFNKGDGTFDLKFFSPRSDYGMDSGPFLIGDFNGDGKSDMLHILPNFNGANVWLNKGDGTFDLRFFSPWNGYSMGIGSFLIGDFNGDKQSDIIHFNDADRVANIWLSQIKEALTPPTCKDFSIILQNNVIATLGFINQINDDQDTASSLKVKLFDLPVCGNIADSSGSAISANTYYSPTTLRYMACEKQMSNTLSYSVMDSTSLESPSCKITIVVNMINNGGTSSPSNGDTSSPSNGGTSSSGSCISNCYTNCDFKGATIIGNPTIICTQNFNTYQINGNTTISNPKPGDKIDVSLYDCIDEGLNAACKLTKGNVKLATCALNLVGSQIGKTAKAIIEEIPIVNKIDDVLDFFTGGAIKNVCDASVLELSLTLFTGFAVLWMS